MAIELLGLEYDNDSYRCFGSEEVKQTAFRLDGIFTPVLDDMEQPLIFVEVQYQADDEFYERLFTEIPLYLRMHKPSRPWLALVIYPTRRIERKPNISFRPYMDLPQLHRIYLEDYRYQQGLSPELELIQLIASTKKKTIELARYLVHR